MSEEPSFEQARKELEEIVDRLESGRAELDEAIALWQRGEELYRLCRAKLDAAEGTVEELSRRADEARPIADDTPFSTDDPTSA